MAKLSTMAAAPLDIELAGQTYKLSPLTHADLADLERWLQGRVVSVAKEHVKDMDPADRQAVLSEMIKHASRLDVTSREATKLLSTVEGAVRLLWLSLRHHHPELTIKQVQELVSDPATLDAAMASFDMVSDLPQQKEQRPKEGTPGKK